MGRVGEVVNHGTEVRSTQLHSFFPSSDNYLRPLTARSHREERIDTGVSHQAVSP